ncbi:MAG TPA: methyltransferase domain-containing protein [Pseudomonadales bacterium]|nr:methyltransferase domain-containing protein [Pseudomonadales bacterium]
MAEQDIIAYYEDCDIDYRLVWGIDKNFSLHYGFYDADNRRHSQAVLNMNKVLAERARVKNGDKILDAGCGVGGSCLWLASHYDVRCTGINICEYQLKRARSLAQKKGLANRIDYQVRSYLDTGFEDNSFDVVWGMESVCYADDKKQFLKEAYRILKPGGRLAVADGFINDANPNPRYDAMLQEWLDGWAVPNLWGQERFKKDLADVGFNNIDFKDGSKNVVPSSHRMWAASQVANKVIGIAELLRIRSKNQNKNVKAAELQYPLLMAGAWNYGIVVAEK